jgi:hypothetical protein|tara:strand:+ start:976 stop:1218 length:243 start_codon:yes stop_codon:yes gene_type:complete
MLVELVPHYATLALGGKVYKLVPPIQLYLVKTTDFQSVARPEYNTLVAFLLNMFLQKISAIFPTTPEIIIYHTKYSSKRK